MKKCSACGREIRAYFVRCQHCGGLPLRENLLGPKLPDSSDEESRTNQDKHYRIHEDLREGLMERAIRSANVASRKIKNRLMNEQLEVAKKWQELAAQAQPKESIVRSTPVRSTPVRSTPVRSTPVRSTPVRSTPVRSTPVSYSQGSVARKWEEELDEASEELIPGAHLQSHYVVTECMAHDAIRVSTRSNDILIGNYSLEGEASKGHRNRILFNLAQFLTKAHYPMVLKAEPLKFESVANNRAYHIELPVTISSEQYDRYNGARLACERALEISDRTQLANQVQQKVADRFGMTGLVCQMTIRLARDAAEALMIELL